MNLRFRFDSSGRWPRWVAIVALWAVATLLSAVQIYLREVSRGLAAPWGEVLSANALAWLPWLAIAPVALRMEQRFPIPGARTGRHVVIQLAGAVGASLLFLLYLAFFHAAYLEGQGAALSSAKLVAEYEEKLGQHFLVAMMLYAAIVLAGFGYRSWSSFLTERYRNSLFLSGVEASAPSSAAPVEPLVARSVGETQRVDPRDIDWIESWGNYARLHLGDRKVLIRRTLTALAAELRPAGFVRVHRSAIVNVDRVAKLRAGAHGDATVELRGGRQIRVSRTHRRALEEQAL